MRRADAQYACGEIGLALVHLARARLPRLADPEGAAHRLFIGEALLEDGLAPRDLLKICDIDPTILDGIKKDFDPAEPRIPAGNRIESGEWTNDYGSGVTPAGNGVQNVEATHNYGSHRPGRGSTNPGRIPNRKSGQILRYSLWPGPCPGPEARHR